MTNEEKHKVCDELKEAIDSGKMGDIVSKHEKLILQYYGDVQIKAKESFRSALVVALIGFGVLIFTVAYALSTRQASLKISAVGVVSGFLIEFISAINFWLYARTSRQFSAFHICLERTHRYLLAYQIAGEIKEGKDKIFGDLVCIMANAPMIAHNDFDPPRSGATEGLTKTVAM